MRRLLGATMGAQLMTLIPFLFGVATATLGVGQAIVWVSTLSFLGLGALPPSPEWGALLEAGRPYIIEAWWLEIIPGLAVLATALTATVLGKFVESTLEGER